MQFDGHNVTVHDSSVLTDDDLRNIKELLTKSGGKIPVGVRRTPPKNRASLNSSKRALI